MADYYSKDEVILNIVTWVVSALIRALKTAAQTLVALIGTDAVNIVSLDWAQMAGIVATAAVVSLATSVAGIPEAADGKSVAKIAKGE